MSNPIKEKARQAYRDQQTQDTEGGCGEPIGFVAGYMACYREIEETLRVRDERIKELEAQLAMIESATREEYEQRGAVFNGFKFFKLPEENKT